MPGTTPVIGDPDAEEAGPFDPARPARPSNDRSRAPLTVNQVEYPSRSNRCRVVVRVYRPSKGSPTSPRLTGAPALRWGFPMAMPSKDAKDDPISCAIALAAASHSPWLE